MEKYFKEEWSYIADARQEIQDIESTIITIDDFEVSIKMSEDFRHRCN